MIIGFSSTKKILSRIIMWATHSKASHSFILFDVAGEPLVLHSSVHGVQCMNYERFLEGKKIVAKYDLLIDKSHEREALASAIRILNRPYDFLSVIGFGWVLLNKIFKRRVKNPFPNKNSYQCSEFVLLVLKAAGLNDALDSFDPELTTPEDLINYLNNNKQARKKFTIL